MDPAAMQAKIGELEASLATVTGALQQLSTQQAAHSAPKLSPAERERLYREDGCFRCRQPGHLAEECTYFNTTRPTSS
eukprot:jgi/Astpho2/5159/Aster-x1276